MPAPEKRGAEPFRIELRRIIARPVEEVYRAWTTPALIAKWFSPGIEEMQVSAEVRTGGPIRIELTYRGAPWRLDGRYLEVIPGKRLRFTWVTTECPAAIGSVVTVNFRDLGSRTELVLLHEGFPDRKTRDDHDATGWQQILEVFVAAEGGALAPQRFADASRTVLAQARGDSYRVEVRRVIARPAAEVFTAWTNPASMEKWICPSGTGSRVTADARVGGRFHIDMLGPNGEVWPHDGEYLEIDPPRRLSFSWISRACEAGVGAVVTVDFHDRGRETEVVLAHFGFPSLKSRDEHQRGWTAILSQLAQQTKGG